MSREINHSTKDVGRHLAVGAIAIVLLTVVAYLPALRCGFIWDDDDYLTNNLTLRSAKGLRQIWTDPNATVQYYPLTFTVFWIEYDLWGLHAFGFHLVNVLLQAANAVLFWRLLSRLSIPGAWWAAAIFALHPVHVMSVAWITELKNVLSGCFFLAALLSYLKFCEIQNDRGSQRPGRRWLYGIAMGLYLCALLSKTATSVLPVAVALILWWKRGRITRTELVPLLPVFGVGIVFGMFTLWLETYAKGASGREFTLSFLERFLVAGRSFWFCLGKLAWPTQLTFIYPRWQINTAVAWQYSFPLCAIGLLVALWWMRQRVGRAPFAALMYFAVAFPALVMIQVLYMMRYSFVADHWQYLGSLSVIPLGIGAATLTLRHCSPALRKGGAMIGAVILAVLGLLTWRQCHIYQNLETLWQDTLAKNPDAWMAHNNLGMLLQDRGDMSGAKEHYEQALRLNPDYPDAHNNMGIVLVQEGKTQEAMAHWEQALRIKPNLANAHYNLGGAFIRLGQVQEAISHWDQAARLQPDDAQTHNDLGGALAQVGRLEDGIAECELALRIRPDYAEAHYNLGLTLARVRRLPEAINHWKQAVRVKPNYAEAHYNLGVALEQTGRLPEAIAHYEQAVRIYPEYTEAQKRLARLRSTQ